MNNKSTNNPAPSPATQTPKAVSRPWFAATHIATCALMFAFGMASAVLWLIEPREVLDVATIFWGGGK